MIAAIMQPYFFPYVGYFQLMNAVDVFVFYDDVQYINRGWVNRNRIWINGAPRWLTLPVRKASRSALINEREYLLDEKIIRKIKTKLEYAYRNAPAFGDVFPVIDELLEFPSSIVASFNANLLEVLARRMGIECAFRSSSQLAHRRNSTAEDRIISLCESVGARHYINAAGGVGLYDSSRFEAAGLKLSFIRTKSAPAVGNGEPENLSIIHTLMHDGFAGCAQRLREYELIDSRRHD